MDPVRQSGSHRLNSWKEIAVFFGRDERTVSRWEKELALPIHRLPGTKGRVFAYPHELLAWAAKAPNQSQSAQGTPEAEPSKAAVLERSVTDNPVLTTKGRHPLLRLLALVTLVTSAVALLISTPKPGASSTENGNTGAVVRPVTTTITDRQAAELYLKGRYYWNKRTPDDLNKALDYFMQAIVRDPGYAPAYSGLADSYNLLREYSMMPSDEAYSRSLAAAKKAAELDDQSSDAHASLAFASFFGMWDVSTGEREFRRSIELNPNNPVVHHWYSSALIALHRLPEAEAEIDRAQALDSASTSILADKGNILCVEGRLDEALRLLKQMESRNPSFRSPHLYLKMVYFRKHDYANYISELRQDAAIVHDDSGLALASAAKEGFAANGEQGMLEAMLKLQKKLYAKKAISPTALAWTCAALGEKNDAVKYLQAAYEQRDGTLLFVRAYPEFDTLNKEPAYRELLAKLFLPLDDAR